MNSKKTDIMGWILNVGVLLLATFVAFRASSESEMLLAGALILLVANERRRAKIITAALVRMVDENGDVRGLVGWTGEGIQIGVRAESVNSNSIAHPNLWQETPNVSFTFKYSRRETGSGKIVERSPAIAVAGEMQREWKTYSMEFSYDRNSEKPDISVDHPLAGGVVSRSIELS